MFDKVLNHWDIRGKEDAWKIAGEWIESEPSYDIYSDPEQNEELRKKSLEIVETLLNGKGNRLSQMKRDAYYQEEDRKAFKIERKKWIENLDRIKEVYKRSFSRGWNEYFGIDFDLIKLFEVNEST